MYFVLLACQVRVTVCDSSLFCIPGLSRTISSLCLLTVVIQSFRSANFVRTSFGVSFLDNEELKHEPREKGLYHSASFSTSTGTTVGGVQIQGFRSVGRRQHASVSGLSLTHETSLYVTVLARNAAGMTSVAYSQPLVVDMTPPDILNLWDGETGQFLNI